jgi:hypothetical protein
MAAGGRRGLSPKMQLALLVNKLDQLTHKPLSVNLNDEQAKKLKEQLQGLHEKDDLTDDDAKTRLDAILVIVEGDKETLEAAGYRWPGERGGGGPGGLGQQGMIPNPFKDEQNGQHLKSLQERVAKKDAK